MSSLPRWRRCAGLAWALAMASAQGLAEEPLRTNRAGTAEQLEFAREGERWQPLGFLCEHRGAVSYARGPLASLLGAEGALRRVLEFAELGRDSPKAPQVTALAAIEPARWGCQGDTCRARYDRLSLGVQQGSDPGAWEDRLFIERSGSIQACSYHRHRYASCLTPRAWVSAIDREGSLLLERVDRASGLSTWVPGGRLQVEGERFTLRFGESVLLLSGNPGAPHAELREGATTEVCQVYSVSPTYLAQRAATASAPR